MLEAGAEVGAEVYDGYDLKRSLPWTRRSHPSVHHCPLSPTPRPPQALRSPWGTDRHRWRGDAERTASRHPPKHDRAVQTVHDTNGRSGVAAGNAKVDEVAVETKTVDAESVQKKGRRWRLSRQTSQSKRRSIRKRRLLQREQSGWLLLEQPRWWARCCGTVHHASEVWLGKWRPGAWGCRWIGRVGSHGAKRHTLRPRDSTAWYTSGRRACHVTWRKATHASATRHTRVVHPWQACLPRLPHEHKPPAPTHGPGLTPQMLECLTHRHQRVVTRSSSTGTGNGSNSAWHCIVGCGGCGRNRRHEQASAAMTRQGKNPATAAAWMPQRAETGECVRPDRY